jgi:hypothetical protein
MKTSIMFPPTGAVGVGELGLWRISRIGYLSEDAKLVAMNGDRLGVRLIMSASRLGAQEIGG